MHKLACSAVSGKECPFVAEGATPEETKAALSAHGMEAHPDMMANATDEDKANMAKMMDDNMQSDDAAAESVSGSDSAM